MPLPKKRDDSEYLLEAIIEGINRKKGIDIINIDLHELRNTECSNYIICHGNSNTHVESIARSVEETVEELCDEKVWHRDGYRNAQWILLDYSNIMVHIFQEPFRKFYDLENLWADANIVHIEPDIVSNV